PTAYDIYLVLSILYKIVYSNTAEDKDELAILKAYQFEDAIIPTLSAEFPTYPENKLISKPLNFNLQGK
ncbi:23327_t:CDS:1, partial [Gigaspora margarita]